MSPIEIILAVTNVVIALLAGGAIPFAISVASRLSRIEAILCNGLRTDVADIKTRCNQHAREFTNLTEQVIRLQLQDHKGT